MNTQPILTKFTSTSKFSGSKEFEFDVIFLIGGLLEYINLNCVQYYENLTCQINTDIALITNFWLYTYYHTSTVKGSI